MTALSLTGMTKTFPNGTQACRSVDFEVRRGEIHALIGENGAGKSTLMRIAFGLEHADRGTIRRRGEIAEYDSAAAAMDDGLGMVHQAFQQVPSLTVAENVVLGAEPTHRGRLDRQAAIDVTNELAASSGLTVDATEVVGNLPVGLRQRVEILRALYRGAEVLILDEPTAVLTPQETDELFDSLRDLLRDGDKSVVIITHKLREVLAIADRATVLRDGAVVGCVDVDEATEEGLAALMVGRPTQPAARRPATSVGADVLSVHELCARRDDGSEALRNLTFEIRAGEIFGIAGVEGNGQSELAESIIGLRPSTSGRIGVAGSATTGLTTREVRQLGVGFIPEDRVTTGLAGTESIADNLILNRYADDFGTSVGLLDYRAIHDEAKDRISEYGIRSAGPLAPAGSLSGGNAQKVVAARELFGHPKLLIAAQPTRGVDIGAIEFLHARLLAERDAGMAILLISADLREVLHLSDRLGVLYEGQFTGVFDDVGALTESEVGEFMLGARRQEAEHS